MYLYCGLLLLTPLHCEKLSFCYSICRVTIKYQTFQVNRPNLSSNICTNLLSYWWGPINSKSICSKAISSKKSQLSSIYFACLHLFSFYQDICSHSQSHLLSKLNENTENKQYKGAFTVIFRIDVFRTNNYIYTHLQYT